MLKRIILLFCILIFFITIGEKNGFSMREEKDNNEYVIMVDTKLYKEELEREITVTGSVIIDSKIKEENITGKLYLISLIRPATYPRYYIQSKSELIFKMSELHYEANWKSPITIGDASDFGKKYYLYFLLIGKQYLNDIQEMNEMSKGEGIGRQEFENNFLAHSHKYYAISGPIPFYRKFPDIRKLR